MPSLPSTPASIPAGGVVRAFGVELLRDALQAFACVVELKDAPHNRRFDLVDFTLDVTVARVLTTERKRHGGLLATEWTAPAVRTEVRFTGAGA
jgi:hypothetical protein